MNLEADLGKYDLEQFPCCLDTVKGSLAQLLPLVRDPTFSWDWWQGLEAIARTMPDSTVSLLPSDLAPSGTHESQLVLSIMHNFPLGPEKGAVEFTFPSGRIIMESSSLQIITDTWTLTRYVRRNLCANVEMRRWYELIFRMFVAELSQGRPLAMAVTEGPDDYCELQLDRDLSWDQQNQIENSWIIICDIAMLHAHSPQLSRILRQIRRLIHLF